jgi:osmotically-inducible protein OsmY
MINNRLFLALLVPQVAMVSAIAADKPTTDDYISDSIRQKLAADTVVKGGDLDVQVKDGAVTLAGKVKEQRQKDRAGSIAKKIHGVKSVVNNIKIEKL